MPFQDPLRHYFGGARYSGAGRPATGLRSFRLAEVLPLTLQVSEQSDVIKRISPDFVTIFAEAERAEMHGLKLICGPGYRKALEFLIKDYVIRLHQASESATDPEKAEAERIAQEIKRQPLAAVINNYATDGKVKQVAARAVWLGNDETHYLRKWEDKDLKDLKALIRLTLHWIEAQELTKEALTSMPAGKP